MISKNRKQLAAVLLVTLTTLLHGQWDQDLVSFAQRQNIEITLDLQRDTVLLRRDLSHVSIDLVGGKLALVNYTEPMVLNHGVKSDGGLFVSQEDLNGLKRIFAPIPEPSGRQITTIVIDPGHGGRDSGAVGSHGEFEIYEKDIVLAVGTMVRNLLGAHYQDKEIIMTRSTDEFITLNRRADIANEVLSQSNSHVLFISIHANSVLSNNEAQGFEVWHIPESYRRDMITTQHKDISDPSLIPIINTLIEEETSLESALLAQYILTGVTEHIGPQLVNRGLRQEEWYVVRSASMPAVLVELGFVSNEAEARRLADPDYQRMLATGLFNGITNFVRDYEYVSE